MWASEALRKRFGSNVVFLTWKVLSKAEQRKIYFVTLAQILLNFLDLIAVSIVGLIGALTISGIGSSQPGNRLSLVLKLVNLDNQRFQTQVAILGIVAALLLICKTLLSMYFNRKILFFLSYRSAVLSSRMVKKLFSQNLNSIQRKSSQETLYGLTIGTNSLMLNIIGTIVGLISDLVLLLLLSTALIVVDPVMAFVTILLFGSVGVALYVHVHVRAIALGEENSRISVKSNEAILEVLSSFREVYVRNRQSYYSNKVGNSRIELAENSAKLAFLPSIGKYIIEIALVFGGVTIAALQFSLNDANHAISTLSIFLASASRIAPAVLRMQSAAITIKSNRGIADLTLDIMSFLEPLDIAAKTVASISRNHENFVAQVELLGVNFSYPGSEGFTLQDINLVIYPGEFLAIVGPSGAGKSTLIDIILGIQTPSAGTVRISNENPTKAVEKWPGAIGYVPQEIFISNSTLGENVSLGFDYSKTEEELITQSLAHARFQKMSEQNEIDLGYSVGERGTRLSGGQRQRLGIARAMFTEPLMLVLDEATSSLDGKTETSVTESIQGMHGKVTVIVIAHRLASVRKADRVVYVDEGRIIAEGSFEEVKKLVPDFLEQAKIMGL